jgi:uncharacterized membrane protein YjjP (DUF1212 family)
MLQVTSPATEVKELGAVLLDIGTLLMSSGASTERIRNNVSRISNSFDYKTELLITHRALTLTISNEENEYVFNSLKRTSPHLVNFKIVSGISRMSWAVVEEGWSLSQIKVEIERLTCLPHYPRVVSLSVVALAGASFCRLAGGEYLDMVIVFVATFIGLFVRQEATKVKFNPYLCIYFAAFAASLVAGLAYKINFGGQNHEHAFATCVLFLIPGVPLINTFSDLIDGNLQNALVRGLNGLTISFSIALGLLTSMFLYRL